MSRKDIKVDLSLLKELVVELEKQLNESYASRDKLSNDKDADGNMYRKFIIDLSKSVGLLSGIASESQLLIGDISKIMKYAVLLPEEDDLMNKIGSLLNKSLKNPGDGGMRN